MSAARLIRRWTVTAGVKCELVATAATSSASASVSIRWLPRMPKSLTLEERRLFRRHRDEAIESAAGALGMRPADVAAMLDRQAQPMADRAAAGKDERGHWTADN